MPIYRASCDNCGFTFDQFLEKDKDQVHLGCRKCGGGVFARQVRDKSVEITEKDGVKGVIRK